MDTFIKHDIAKMKSDIKSKSEEQRFLKNQRKTVNIVGERKMPAWEASCNHNANRYDLRILYSSYALARNKVVSETELKLFPKSIDRVLEKYLLPIEV